MDGGEAGGSGGGAEEGDAGVLDAGLDGGLERDGGVDAGLDAGVDAGLDAGVDAGVDAGPPRPDAGPGPWSLTVTVNRVSPATGTVTSLPGGINCGSTCTAMFGGVALDAGNVIELTATPGSQLQTIQGWTGDCADAGLARRCRISMDGPKTAGVTFTPYNVMFVTSARYSKTRGGVAPYDATCQQLASAAGFPGTYVAWMSGTNSAINRILGARGWVRPDGRPFADSTTSLAAGRVLYVPRVTETGNLLPAGDLTVMTGTGPSGQGNAYNCADWSDAGAPSAYGVVDMGTGAWTQYAIGGNCTGTEHHYCFGTSFDAPVALSVPAAARRAFLSTPWAPGSGLAGADTHCSNLATDAGFPGTYRALLATSTASAASRFSGGGNPWYRPDGVQLSNTGTDLLGGSLQASLNVTAAGSYGIRAAVLTGAASLSSIGTIASTCSDWTSTAGQATTSQTTITSNFWSATFMANCNAGTPMYCLQQ
ncbi:MAG: hypothetical protein JNK82_21055 [Myxococcaceae bacterium]|nr:hypothetical protein [Myxococcaceae bacterium]